jgi:predicted TIM-barrel fold metal-dependent hydrolase
VSRLSTHDGVSNGLQAQALGNEACYRFARAHPGAFLFGSNEVPDLGGSTREIRRYLKRGAVVIGEQKFGVECDAPAMRRIYELAEAHRIPVLMHWQHGMYNYGFERFRKMLERYSRVTFIGHAQTWWANIDRNHVDQSVLYPKGSITPGGLTDRYLADYPNMYGDLSAGSGLNALTRDEAFTREFVVRHQDKLLFGSDCGCIDGHGGGVSQGNNPTAARMAGKCVARETLGLLKRSTSPDVFQKIVWGNAHKLLRIPA